MITDEEIAAIEKACKYSPDGKTIAIDQRKRDSAIYQLGRQHQRESDAALFHAECDRAANVEDEEQAERASEWAAAIEANTEDNRE